MREEAEKNKVSPEILCDLMAPAFINLWEKLNINYSDFIRTTEHRHQRDVQNILNQVYKNGDIYQDEYEGWNSISEERFITEKEVVGIYISGHPLQDYLLELKYFCDINLKVLNENLQ